ncbi:MAG: ECF RNA polymerase sigma factor SigW [Firmicutes bacterium]|nr:ECF RNA polymerase sigma factor SigW [Bacillota bacterium]
MERAQRDPEAFGLLYEQNYDAIFNYVLRRMGHVETTQDIVSETFFIALRNLGKFKWQGVPFSAWLYRIAINEMAGHFRCARGRTVSLETMQEEGFEPPSDSDVEREALAWQEEIDRHLEYHAVKQAVDALPEHYQEVVSLRFYAGKQIPSIAVVLGKPQGTVKSLLHRGLEKLRHALRQAKRSATFGETPTYVERGRGSHGE